MWQTRNFHSASMRFFGQIHTINEFTFGQANCRPVACWHSVKLIDVFNPETSPDLREQFNSSVLKIVSNSAHNDLFYFRKINCMGEVSIPHPFLDFLNISLGNLAGHAHLRRSSAKGTRRIPILHQHPMQRVRQHRHVRLARVARADEHRQRTEVDVRLHDGAEVPHGEPEVGRIGLGRGDHAGSIQDAPRRASAPPTAPPAPPRPRATPAGRGGPAPSRPSATSGGTRRAGRGVR